jgi:hypothetical protein
LGAKPSVILLNLAPFDPGLSPHVSKSLLIDAAKKSGARKQHIRLSSI